MLYWPLPPQATADAARVGALQFLSGLLGDEGAGSVLSALKAAGVGESVSTGVEVDTSGFALMQLEVALSPATVAAARAAGSDGARVNALHAAADRIAGTVFLYLRLLADELRAATRDAAAALVRTGNADLLCGHSGATSGGGGGGDTAAPGQAQSAGSLSDGASGVCRSHAGALVDWLGNGALATPARRQRAWWTGSATPARRPRTGRGRTASAWPRCDSASR